MKLYQDEVVNTKFNSVFIFFTIIMAYALYGIYQQSLNEDLPIFILLLVYSIIILFMGLLGFLCFANIITAKKNQKIRNKIINNGVKVPGKIVEIITLNHNDYKKCIYKKAAYAGGFKNDALNCTEYYFAIVEYEGSNHTIQTPSLNFNPEYLADDTVDVYVYNNKCYVNNYKFNYDKANKTSKANTIVEVYSIITFFTIFAFVGLMVYLNVNDIVPFKAINILLPIGCIVLVVVGYFITLKKALK